MTFDTLSNRLECHRVPHLPGKTTWQPAWKPSKRKGFAASPIDTARPQENQRLETRHVGASKRAFLARILPIFTLCSFKIGVSYEFSDEPLHLLPQNRCFVRGFGRFSSLLTKCHACQGICTLSSLDAALTMRFAKTRTTRLKCCARHAKWQYMTMDTSKVLRLPRKLQLILRKRRKSIAPATHTQKRLSTPYETRYETQLRDAGNIQKWLLLQNLLWHGHTALTRTVADG